MCEMALFNIAPEETKKTSKFSSQWGSVLDYMDLSVPEPLSSPACVVPENPYEDKEHAVEGKGNSLIHSTRQFVRVKHKHGQLYKALESHENFLNRKQLVANGDSLLLRRRMYYPYSHYIETAQELGRVCRSCNRQRSSNLCIIARML
eukprot:TRINITY_DN11379_c0_g1_i2.p1 TRINITY_DN11379_c0_g1~~TRINITY_DN11379_c0_g1_i2.p1  ORF type:complete len:148 (-),score=0.91 TRINITY_DN11379_c0_g1_i2:122-565(-)